MADPLNSASQIVGSNIKDPRTRVLTIILVIAIVFSVITSTYLLTRKSTVSRLLPKVFGPKEPTVELKAQYRNPFKKETQYVNPFDQFKSPFHTAP